MKVCLAQSLVFSKQNVGQGHENCIYATVLAAITDYGHTMAKFLILCSPNTNPNQKKRNLGFGYKGLVFCGNIG